MLFYWIRNSSSVKSKLGPILVFPIAWINATRRGRNLEKSYKKYDPYIMDFQKSVFNHNPEIWLEPPEELQEYVIEERWERIKRK